jgi:hypothetical protein
MRHIRTSLDGDMAKSVATSLVSSRLDYANSLLYGTPAANLNKIQRVQNYLAKIVSQNYYTSSSVVLHTLHWLPVKQRIEFKLATLTYKLRQSGSPSYLASVIHSYVPVRSLSSSELDLLSIPCTRIVLGSKAFSIAAPTIWNSRPLHIRQASSIASVRRHLKTHFFTAVTAV